MTLRSLRSALLATTLFLASCGEDTVGTLTPPPPPPPSGPAVTGPGPFLVSDAPTRVGAGVLGAASLGDASVAWVALRPGSLPGFTSVTLRVQRTGVETISALEDGGLDPVAIGAVRGDTVVLRVSGGAGPVPPALVFTVPERTPPVIVRTVPPVGKRDVPLNSLMQVVFSEPVGPSALQAGAIVLQVDGSSVAGQVRFANAERTVAELEPVDVLRPLTAYQLVVGTQVTDLDGMPLPSPSVIEFVTAGTAQVPPPPNPPPFEGTVIGEFAFVRDNQIFVSTAQGVTQLTNDLPGIRNDSPVWSPDGTRIAFTSFRDWASPCPPATTCGFPPSLYVMNADGSNVVRLTYEVSASDPSWAPDGLSLVFASGLPVTSPGAWGGAKLFRVSVNGGAPTLLLESTQEISSPAISPDGSSLAVSISRVALPAENIWGVLFDMYRMSLAPGASPVLVHAGPTGGQFVHFLNGMWSPDGQWIAMIECEDSSTFCFPGSYLGVVRADGTGYARLTPHATWSSRLSWSPDGTRLAFTTDSGCGGVGNCIAVIGAMGGTPEVILHNARDPAWRP